MVEAIDDKQDHNYKIIKEFDRRNEENRVTTKWKESPTAVNVNM
jgi:hypothetical protein